MVHGMAHGVLIVIVVLLHIMDDVMHLAVEGITIHITILQHDHHDEDHVQ